MCKWLDLKPLEGTLKHEPFGESFCEGEAFTEGTIQSVSGSKPRIQFVSITLEFLVAHDIIDLRWLQSGWPCFTASCILTFKQILLICLWSWLYLVLGWEGWNYLTYRTILPPAEALWTCGVKISGRLETGLDLFGDIMCQNYVFLKN